jgi:hypothetical protein
MALPMLEAMVPRNLYAGPADAPPTRLLVFYVPNGIHMSSWTPAQTGTDFELPPILSPLAAHKDDLLVMSGLDNLSGIASVPGDHARGTGSFLTCMPVFKTEGDNIENGISIDQHIAQQIGDKTRFSSLELGMEGGSSTGGCDSGYSCAYSRNIAWSGPSTPVAKEANPREAFDRLFGDMSSTLTVEEAARRKILRTSVLDYVRDDAQRLQAKLGTRDRQKLDQYLTGVSELEKQILTLEDENQCYPGPGPSLVLDLVGHIRAMCDIMVLAFQCDQTRMITFMTGNAGSSRVFGNLGHTDAHHYLSHHDNESAKLQAIEAINLWEIQQFTYLLDQLKAVEEGDGTLLDNSIVYFSSEIEDGNSHRHKNLPVLVAGRGGGQINPGRHIQYDGDPIANLYVSFMNMMGVEGSTFGADGTGPLGQLT